MNLLINGEATEYVGAPNISGLISERFPDAGKIAVAVNQEFVPRSGYDTYEIKDGDDIEIVAPMQGG